MARASNKFSRAKATLKPRPRFTIYCEGSSTEPGYFNALGRAEKALIEIQVLPAGVPMTVAERAVAFAVQNGLSKSSRKKSKNFFEKQDQVWAVFDVDEHPNFDAAVRLCERSGVGVGRANPCFEIWLILHLEDFHRPDDRHAVGRYLRSLRPEYDPHGTKTCHWTELIPHVETAERRAANQLEQRALEGSSFGRPSTTLGNLTAAIREAARPLRRGKRNPV